MDFKTFYEGSQSAAIQTGPFGNFPMTRFDSSNRQTPIPGSKAVAAVKRAKKQRVTNVINSPPKYIAGRVNTNELQGPNTASPSL